MPTRSIRAITLVIAAGAFPIAVAGCKGTTSVASESGGSDAGNRGAWINRTAGSAAANYQWNDLASDASGAHLVAVTGLTSINPGGDIWTSSDSGATWINRTKGTQASGQIWKSVASDSTGLHLVAVAGTTATTCCQDVWTSADGGATWGKRTTVTSTVTLAVGPVVASDSTGTHLVLADGDIWTSSDSGATWIDQTKGTSFAAQNWVDLASDSTGSHLVAITAYSDIWTSSDSGATWIIRTMGTTASGQDWQGVASDSTGTHLVAVCGPSGAPGGGLDGGDIWVSSDSGATWTNRTKGTAASGKIWVAAASDAAGAHFIAAAAHGNANDIWTSADSGMTWFDETTGTSASGQQWVAVASNATGSHFAAVSSDPPGGGGCCFGDVWTN